jgi:hypothetical protein
MERRERPIGIWDVKWINHYFDLPVWGRAVLVGLLAALLGFILDEAAHAFGYPWFYERLGENVVEGVFIGMVVFWLSVLREKRMDRRMREIGYLNHHIRNAMQAIKLVAEETADAQQRLAVINLSVRRVTETLSLISRLSDEANLERSSNLEYAT